MNPARPALPSTVRRFIAFRVLFSARFYYPVLAILFLDLGLTMEQYAGLNAVWAVAIVLCEVPSGAIADRFGRRRLVVFASILMIAEMLALLLAPASPGALLIGCVVLNRILSGVAEASASGADEALAYDTLQAAGRANEWPEVLTKVMRWQSVGFVISSILGAAAYDPNLLNSAAHLLGIDARLTQTHTTKLPVALTLLSAIAALLTTLGMREAPRHETPPHSQGTWRLMGRAGRWILNHRFFLLLILSAVCFDSFIRLFLTIESSYLRLIAIPEATYGLIGTGFALLGFAVPALASYLIRTQPPGRNLALIALLTVVGLIGVAITWKGYGLLFILSLGIAFFLINFLLSHHLNRGVDSAMRATVLSFKGLAMNVAYGTAGLVFSALVALSTSRHPGAGADAALRDALGWLAPLFVLAVLPLALRWPRLREPSALSEPSESNPAPRA